MGLTYAGSKKLADIFPPLKASADALSKAVTVTEGQKQRYQAEIEKWNKRIQAAQADLSLMSNILGGAQTVLGEAQDLLDQANGVINGLGNALNQAGIHVLHYTGPFYALGTKLALAAVDRTNYPNTPGANDCVYALVVIASDGGAVQALVPILGGITDVGSAVDSLGQDVQQFWANIMQQLNAYAATQEGNPGGNPASPVPSQPPAANACDWLIGGGS